MNIILVQASDIGQRLAFAEGVCGRSAGEQTAISYVTDTDLARLQASPQLEGLRGRGIEVLLPIRWTASG